MSDNGLLSTWGGLPLFDGFAATGAFSAATFDLNTTGFKVAATFKPYIAGASDTITHVGYRQGVTTGTPAAASYKIGVQGVSATTGNPDGTYLGGGSPASAEFQPTSGNDSTWQWIALDNSISINAGQTVALVLETGSGWTTGNKITATHYFPASRRSVFPVPQSYNGSWTKRGTDAPALAMKSAGHVYGWPYQSAGTTRNFGATAEAGFWFNIPTNFCSTFKLVGLRAIILPPGANKSFVVNVYENPLSGSIASIQATDAMDSDIFAAASSAVRTLEVSFEGTAPTLNAGTDYVVGFATTTASEGALYTADVASAGDFDAISYRQQTAYTTRTLTDFPPSGNDTNNFAAVTATSRPYVELILAEVTAPAGGSGGMIVHPGMSGRLI
jgi:hypothetical protein